MSIPELIQVRLVGSSQDIQEMEKSLAAAGDQVQIVSRQKEDPGSYRFNISDAAALGAILQATFYTGELSVSICRWIKKNKGKDKLIIVQTPLGRWEFQSEAAMTEDQVRKILKQIANMK